jgi:hypothetical protein
VKGGGVAAGMQNISLGKQGGKSVFLSGERIPLLCPSHYHTPLSRTTLLTTNKFTTVPPPHTRVLATQVGLDLAVRRRKLIGCEDNSNAMGLPSTRPSPSDLTSFQQTSCGCSLPAPHIIA